MVDTFVLGMIGRDQCFSERSSPRDTGESTCSVLFKVRSRTSIVVLM